MKVGFIGLGTMGGPMARKLIRAGYAVTVYDLDPAKVEALVGAGASTAKAGSAGVSTADASAAADEATVGASLPEYADVVCLSLPSSAVAVRVLEDEVLPTVRPGAAVIDFGTTLAAETRRLSQAFTDKGAQLLDAPVSGGPKGAEEGSLYVFVGGDELAFVRVQPLLETLGETVTYCGPSGSGQIVKAVNQLAMGLPVAGYLEAVAFGVQAGIDPAMLDRAVGGSRGFRADVRRICRAAHESSAEHVTIKFPEFAYFLDEARARGMQTPILEALHQFLDPSERRVRDNMGRPEPSFWFELVDGERHSSRD